jgi:hypothetical protein
MFKRLGLFKGKQRDEEQQSLPTAGSAAEEAKALQEQVWC